MCKATVRIGTKARILRGTSGVCVWALKMHAITCEEEQESHSTNKALDQQREAAPPSTGSPGIGGVALPPTPWDLKQVKQMRIGFLICKMGITSALPTSPGCGWDGASLWAHRWLSLNHRFTLCICKTSGSQKRPGNVRAGEEILEHLWLIQSSKVYKVFNAHLNPTTIQWGTRG